MYTLEKTLECIEIKCNHFFIKTQYFIIPTTNLQSVPHCKGIILWDYSTQCNF